MVDQTISLNSPIFFEAGEALVGAEIVVDSVIVVDGQQYIVGTYDAGRLDSVSGDFISKDDLKQFMVAVDEPMEIDGLMNKQLNAMLQAEIPQIIETKAGAGAASFVISSGENFDDVYNAARNIGAPAPPPVAAMPSEPEGPRPLNLEAGEPIRIQDPVLFEGFDLDGQKGDLVIDEIAFADDKPFLTGSFTVETPTGSQTREFAIAIDETRFPAASSLTDQDLAKLVSPEIMDDMIASRKHGFVLSLDEGFPDRGRLLSDINGILDYQRGSYVQDLPDLARLGQAYPGLMETLDLYSHRGDFVRNEEIIKLTILDHVGITDGAVRERLLYNTASMEDFLKDGTLNQSLFDAGKDTTRVIEGMADTAKALAQRADDVADVSRVAKGLRAAGTFLGPAVTAASIAGTSYASDLQRDFAFELKENGTISEDAYNAYWEMNVENNVALGAADGADFLGPIGTLLTLPVEYRATQSLKAWADEYAPNISDADFQALSQGLISGSTARTEMLLEAAGSVPHDPDGQPEVLHELIEARNAYYGSRNDVINENGRLAGTILTPEDEDNLARLRDLEEMAEERLIGEMEQFMSDPENISLFLDLIPIDDRMAFVRRLAESEADPENLAAIHPEVASYLAAYEDANVFQTRIFGFAEDDVLRESPDILNAYIIARSGAAPPETPELGEIRSAIDLMAGAELPDTTPPEMAALIELHGAPEQQEAYYQELLEDGHIEIVGAFLNGYEAPASAPEPVSPQREYASDPAVSASISPT